jgi:beta-glucanase (GH16 family)
MTAALLSACCAAACAPTPPAATNGVPGWSLVWEDDFDGAAGDAIDGDRWGFDVGGDGWGNSQLEHNTDRTDNVRVDGDGNLVIEARIEDYEGNAYTSGRIKTQDRFTLQYGRVEARIRLPKGGGVWPAFWMLGADIDTVGWPNCGEIDILELRGEEPYTALGTVHGPGYAGVDSVGAEYTLAEGDFSDDFHVFAVDIDPDHIAWSIDDVVFQTLTPADLPDGTAWVFDSDFFLILNVAVGGHFVGPVDDEALPAQMTVDYVRVYERAG